QTGGAHGMCLLDSSLADLVKSGAITRGEALRHAEEPSRFAASGPGLAAPAVGAAAGAPGVMGSAAAQPAGAHAPPPRALPAAAGRRRLRPSPGDRPGAAHPRA